MVPLLLEPQVLTSGCQVPPAVLTPLHSLIVLLMAWGLRELQGSFRGSPWASPLPSFYLYGPELRPGETGKLAPFGASSISGLLTVLAACL